MRYQSSITARQLHSVAQRYRRAATGRTLENTRRGNPNWREDFSAASEEDESGHDPRLQRLEAILLLAREPLSIRKLSQYASLADGTEARTLIQRLNEEYDHSGQSFRIERVAGGYQFLTRAKFASWIRSLESTEPPARFSAPAMETLAVVAYRQPVLRADIEAIRGVGCGEILRQLMERDLVRIGGRSDELGRPYLYATTKKFLQLFGLLNLEELPRIETFRETAPNDILGEDPENINVLNGENGNQVDRKDQEIEEESEVSVTTADELHSEKELHSKNQAALLESLQAIDDEGEEGDEGEEYDDEEEDEYDDDEDDGLDDEDPDDDEAYDDDELEEEELDDDGFEEDEWEEVDDEDEEEGVEGEEEDLDDEDWEDEDEDEDLEDEDAEEDDLED